MGTIFSNAGQRDEPSSSDPPFKWPRVVPIDMWDCSQGVISGIPDEISLCILALIPHGCYPFLRLVCRRWYDLLVSKKIFDARKNLHATEEWLYVLVRNSLDRFSWHALDPVSGRWQTLPPMAEAVPNADAGQPNPSYSWWGFPRMKLFRFLRFLFRQKEELTISRFCGCAAGAVDGCLYVVGGFSQGCACKSVWRYDPRINKWQEAAALGTARAYCKTAALRNKLYVIGGLNRDGQGLLTPLQCGEVYEPSTNIWKPISSMPFTKAQVLPTAFLGDMIKPIATGMAPFRDQLCVPQSLYSWPFIVDAGGEIFDLSSESWVEMPRGMGEGWPARQVGTKLSAVVNGSLYALDPTGSLDGCQLKVYDNEVDVWKVVSRHAPLVLDLFDSESPYLLAGSAMWLYVIMRDVTDDIVVLRADVCGSVNPAASALASNVNAEAEPDAWTTIARTKLGAVELMACQVLTV